MIQPLLDDTSTWWLCKENIIKKTFGVNQIRLWEIAVHRKNDSCNYFAALDGDTVITGACNYLLSANCTTDSFANFAESKTITKSRLMMRLMMMVTKARRERMTV